MSRGNHALAPVAWVASAGRAVDVFNEDCAQSVLHAQGAGGIAPTGNSTAQTERDSATNTL